MDLRVFFYRKFVAGQGRVRSIERKFLEKMRKSKKKERAFEGGMRQTEGTRVDGKKHLLGYMLYRECRGEHCSPANLMQQGFSGKALHIARGHGRAMLASTEFYNGRIIYKQ